MTIAIVGGGIAGLYVARELTTYSRERIVVIEANPNLGGRISTEHDARTNEVLFERGPWRIAEDHARVRALCGELKIPLTPSEPPLKHQPAPDTMPGLSIWDCNALNKMDPAFADRKDRATGYPDQTHAASGSSPYISSAKSYSVAPGGLDQITEKLAATVRGNKGEIWVDTRVTDVIRTAGTGKYRLHLSERDDKNSFKATTMSADQVIVCVPPHAWRPWTIARKCTTVIEAVQSLSLFHIYARRLKVKEHELTPMGQQIPSQYGNDWSQAMYSSGRLADFWYRLRLSYPQKFSEALGMPLQQIRTHYWKHAIHMWRPVFNFDLERAVAASVQPNPRELPGVYLANESHSSFQAWMEGALEMAQRVTARMLHGERFEAPSRLPRNHLIVEGWVIDVTKWKVVHPGSRKAIENHIGEEVTDLFNHIGHSEVARATVHSLKVPLSPQ